nr:MAG TPA: hypothetical protein [Caudoviricetes sp.]
MQNCLTVIKLEVFLHTSGRCKVRLSASPNLPV